LLEVQGFSWILFLWSNVKGHFSSRYAVRLDKLAHSDIQWNIESLQNMLDARLRFFSDNRLSLKDIFEESIDPEAAFHSLTDVAMNSPRELIKVMDTIFREHDARGDDAPTLIDQRSIEIGLNKFSVETMGGWFAAAPLQQVLRLGLTTFKNKDVQSVYKIGDQGARVKIKNWEDAGLVKQSGTAASDTGAKQAYLFTVTDARVKRVIQQKLLPVVGAGVEQPEVEVEG
jgi:hypothetical protein